MGLPSLLLAYATGLALAPYLFIPPSIPLLAAVAGLAWLTARRRPAATALLLLFFVLFGLTRYQAALAPPTETLAACERAGDRPVVLAGSLAAVTARSDGRGAFDLELRQLDAGGGPLRAGGRVRVYLGTPPGSLLPGQEVRLRARLRRPRNFGTPGEFDFARHLARQGIFLTAFAADAGDVVPLAGAGAANRVGAWRRAAGDRLDAALGPARSHLLRALLLGERELLPEADRELLARGGISHLFSISGLHLALLAGFLFVAGRTLWGLDTRLLQRLPPRRFLPLLLIPVLYGYLLLTGSAMATTRAFLVAAGGALYLALGRHTPPLRLLAATALLLLLFDPLAAFEPGFQLSFAGAAGLLWLLPRWYPAVAGRSPAVRRAAGLALTTLAATLATFPLVLWHFHLVAPAGLVANLFAVPLVGFVALPVGLAGLPVAAVLPAAAEPFFLLADGALRLALRGTAWLTAWPGLEGRFWYPPPATLLAVGLLVLALALARGGPWSRTALLLPLLAALLVFAAGRPAPGPLTVTALSVGQGEATLLELPDGRRILVDGGGFADSRFDVGERLVAPALARLDATALAAVVLSHPHPDHYLGLRHVLETLPVGELWLSAAAEDLPPALAAATGRKGIRLRRFPPGWAATPFPGLHVFSPGDHGPFANDSSLVLYARQGERGVLLTGDLEDAGVAALLASPPPGPVDLLKLPHHGSRNSAPMLLLDALEPRAAFVSVGHGNRYGLPSAEVVTALGDRSVPLWRTDRHGTVRLRAGERGWLAKHWEKGLFR